MDQSHLCFNQLHQDMVKLKEERTSLLQAQDFQAQS